MISFHRYGHGQDSCDENYDCESTTLESARRSDTGESIIPHHNCGDGRWTLEIPRSFTTKLFYSVAVSQLMADEEMTVKPRRIACVRVRDVEECIQCTQTSPLPYSNTTHLGWWWMRFDRDDESG